MRISTAIEPATYTSRTFRLSVPEREHRDLVLVFLLVLKFRAFTEFFVKQRDTLSVWISLPSLVSHDTSPGLRNPENPQEARQQLGEGIDPSAKKQTSGKTFEVVAREWHVHWKTGRNERHAYYVLKRLEADIFPEMGSIP